MSLFTTTIKVPVDAVLATLPPKSVFKGRPGLRLSEDGRSVLVEWSNERWVTPWTRAREVSLGVLEGSEPQPAWLEIKGEAGPTPAEKTVKVEPSESDEGFKRVQTDTVAPHAPRVAKRKR
jgi:hypothetical protein